MTLVEQEQREMLRPINNILKNFELSSGVYAEIDWCEDELQAALSKNQNYIYTSCIDSALGASKFVLLPEDLENWIIKIPIRGLLTEEGEEDFDKTDEVLPGEQRYNKWDYCETEEKIYSIAKILGIENMFSETRYIGKKDGYPIYISEKMYDIGGFKNNNDVELSPEVSNLLLKMYGYLPKNEWDNIPLDVFQEMYNTYGKQDVIKFVTLLAFEGVKDFHKFNFGWSLAEEPVIIDYSGFFY